MRARGGGNLSAANWYRRSERERERERERGWIKENGTLTDRKLKVYQCFSISIGARFSGTRSISVPSISIDQLFRWGFEEVATRHTCSCVYVYFVYIYTGGGRNLRMYICQISNTDGSVKYKSDFFFYGLFIASLSVSLSLSLSLPIFFIVFERNSLKRTNDLLFHTNVAFSSIRFCHRIGRFLFPVS